MEESSAEEHWLIGKPAGVFASCLPRSEQAEQFARSPIIPHIRISVCFGCGRSTLTHHVTLFTFM